MAMARYLAVTAAEMEENPQISAPAAILGPTFTQEPPGISSLPEHFPEGSVLMVSDLILPQPHIMNPICDALRQFVFSTGCQNLILDFQQPGKETAAALIHLLLQELPCSVIVSDLYAQELSCPVFLSPLPYCKKLTKHLAPWKNRDIWLDLSAQPEIVTLHEQGINTCIPEQFRQRMPCHEDAALFCHYTIAKTENSAEFTMWRTKADLEHLLTEAENCGIKAAVALFQEWNKL
ncbi:MAG: hypothetical protein J6V25_07625 [Oscillospiraceae bacterium]|nr:hypothetical protein [Oscillospiraceae bacterium]